jgi:hypothetical protein
MTNYFADKHQPTVNCPFVHVIHNFLKMVRHHLVDWPLGKVRSYFMFLHPKPKWKSCYDVWFIVMLVGQN